MSEELDAKIESIQSAITELHQKGEIVSLCARDYVIMSALILGDESLKVEIAKTYSCRREHSDKIISHFRSKGVQINSQSQNLQASIQVLVSTSVL